MEIVGNYTITHTPTAIIITAVTPDPPALVCPACAVRRGLDVLTLKRVLGGVCRDCQVVRVTRVMVEGC